MLEQNSLIPVFVPPLALMLGHAENTKGSQLTEAEAVAVRDQSSCIMMEAEHAAEMTAKRGYRDVNPENCWADWHRLRAEITGKGYLPKIILCIVGEDNYRDTCEPILKAAGVEHEFRGHDDAMERAFRTSALGVMPQVSDDEFAQIRNHETVLYVLSKNFGAGSAIKTAVEFMQLGRQLLDAGGVAIKCESSGIAQAKRQWITLANVAEKNAELSTPAARQTLCHALFRAFIRSLIGDRQDLYSCGMHLLGMPDLIISDALMRSVTPPGEPYIQEAATLFRVFSLYLLAECPDGKFASGNTFSIERGSPRFRLIWEPCSGYEEDNFFFNPFGRWRFTKKD